MELLELHLLQSYPVCCPNRDDLGAAKSAYYGGVRRARISSQCMKRSQRRLFRELAPEHGCGIRTRLLPGYLLGLLQARGAAGAESLAAALAGIWCKVDARKSEPTAGAPVYFSPAEAQLMVQAALARREEKPKATPAELAKAAAEALPRGHLLCDAADIALFGRMVTSAPELSTEAAAMYTHALSTHLCEPELDYFTTADDLLPTGAGAGGGGMLEFCSACYYRYVGLNVDQLRENLGQPDAETLRLLLRAFVDSALRAAPQARRGSMCAACLPDYALGLHRRSGCPVQLSAAFEDPVLPERGFAAPSRERLRSFFRQMQQTWNLKAEVTAELPDMDAAAFTESLTAPLDT